MKYEREVFLNNLKDTFSLDNIRGDEVFRDVIENYDSLKGFTIISMVEEDYGIIIDLEKYKSMVTFNDILFFIEASLPR